MKPVQQFLVLFFLHAILHNFYKNSRFCGSGQPACGEHKALYERTVYSGAGQKSIVRLLNLLRRHGMSFCRNVNGGGMNRVGAILLAAGLSCVALGVMAQTKKPSKETAKPSHKIEKSSAIWENEPESFLGISFTQPIPGDMPKCEYVHTGSRYAISNEGPVCANKLTQDIYSIYRTPKLAFDYELSITLSSGLPGFVYLQTDRSNFPKMKEVFVAKYGSPTTTTVEKVTTKSGATFDAQFLKWSGKNVTLKLNEVVSNINTASAEFTTTEWQKASKNESEKNTADSVNKL
jgi:hypothetical protein